MKPIALFFVLLFLLTAAGCTDAQKQTLDTEAPADAILYGEHAKQLHDYDSPYTVCYDNTDGTYTMYIYASPIQYQTDTGYQPIDNTVITSEKKGFAFENKANEVKTYFPCTLENVFRVEKDTDYLEFRAAWNIEGFSEATQTMYTNMYGDTVSAVLYERNDMDAVFYPTKAGIKTELVLKDTPDADNFLFAVRTNAISWENNQNGYIKFHNNEDIQSIIYAPLMQYEKDGIKQLDSAVQIDLKREGGDTLVSIAPDAQMLDGEKAAYPLRLDPSFEMYLNKMPDTTVYSAHAVNNYLASYAVIGDHPSLGTGWHYLRIRLNWFLGLKGAQIISATYYIRNLYSAAGNACVNLLDMEQQWSSTKMLWDSRATTYKNYLNYEGESERYLDIAITDFVKKAVDDTSWMEESHGLLMQAPEKSPYMIFATSDNALYPPYLRLDMDALPKSFSLQDNINPPS